MSLKYFVTFKDKYSRDSDATSVRGEKTPQFLSIFVLFPPFFFYVIQK